MTDYLEEVLEHTRALLEEVQRLERPLSGQTKTSASDPDNSGLGRACDNSSLGGGIPSPAGAEQPAGTLDISYANGMERQTRGDISPLWGQPDWTEERASSRMAQTEEGSSPLLDQIERLERAAFSWRILNQRSGFPGGGTKSASGQGGYPRALSGPGQDVSWPGLSGTTAAEWTPGIGKEQPGLLAADEALWAERTDRIFRRDSRRYDGGFYLY